MQVGNKSDLLRARQVPADEGETLAASLGGASSSSFFFFAFVFFFCSCSSAFLVFFISSSSFFILLHNYCGQKNPQHCQQQQNNAVSQIHPLFIACFVLFWKMNYTSNTKCKEVERESVPITVRKNTTRTNKVRKTRK